MKRGKLLNSELSYALASMGHGDYLIVCDAGFPIPSQVWRIDLAIRQDLPDLATVLELIHEEFIAEKVSYGAELEQYNAPLLATVKRIFAESELVPVPHERIMTQMNAGAKAIVRTGAFDPFGNIVLYSGVDAPRWFSKPGLVVPEHYRARVARGQAASGDADQPVVQYRPTLNDEP
jgi:simple sugar transport system permease protein/D-ribose pyranase